MAKKGEPDLAITEFRVAIKIAPNDPEIHTALGSALRQKGATEAAREELQLAAKLTKQKRDFEAAATAVQTGMQRLNEGRIEAAVERFQAAIKLNPDYALAHYQLSLAYRKKGQTVAAQTALKQAEQLGFKPKKGP